MQVYVFKNLDNFDGTYNYVIYCARGQLGEADIPPAEAVRLVKDCGFQATSPAHYQKMKSGFIY